jgi:hypothetical protein
LPECDPADYARLEMIRIVAIAAILVAAAAQLAEARTNGVRWEQTATLADRVDEAAAARYRNWHCVFQGGPEYTFTIGTTGKRWKSTTYFLEGFGSSCRFAKKWIRRLAKEPYSAGSRPRPRTPAMHRGPKGWRCQGSFIPTGEHPLTQFDGVCQNRRNKARVFSWEPQTGYDDGPVDPAPLPPDPAPEPEPAPEPPPEL